MPWTMSLWTQVDFPEDEERMFKKVVVVLLAVGAGWVAGCKSELDNKSAAKVGEALVEAAPPAEAMDKYAVDVASSSIEWVGAKVTGDHVGGFKQWEGAAWVQDDKVARLEFTVDTASIFSDAERLTGHLKSEDFFHVEQYPDAKFVTTQIVEKVQTTRSDAGSVTTTHEVTGNFTVRGVTRSVTFPATIALKENLIQAGAEFTFKRFDFGIAYKGKADDLIRDEVLLKIALQVPMVSERT